MEKVVEVKNCKHCNTGFEITDKDMEFYKKISPVFNREKYQVPSPTLCPDCRMQRRMSFRNERNLYKRECSATGKSIISMYHPGSSHKVYEQKFWFSDKWDAMDYGFLFDGELTLFSQLSNLFQEIPLPSMYSYFLTNSDYCNCVNYQKNCYLVFAASKDEKCMYSSYVNDSINVVDSYMMFDCENCYNCIDLKNCNFCFHTRNSIGASYCNYSSDLVNCHNCFGCDNLAGKSYCFENK